MTTFYIKWGTPDGERSEWIEAQSLQHALLIAELSESTAMYPVQRAMELDRIAYMNMSMQNALSQPRDVMWTGLAGTVAGVAIHYPGHMKSPFQYP